MSELTFEAQKALRGMDLGEQVGDDKNFFLKDLGRTTRGPSGPPVVVEPNDPIRPKTRAERERVPMQMAANLMDYYISILNDDMTANPIRDGIPQCRRHPFNPPKSVGCVHSCAKRNPEMVLPVAREYSLLDVFNWVKELVILGVSDVERQRGWRRPTDLKR